MSETDFNELLHAAERLSADVEVNGELPRVERTLRQVLEASTELWSRVTQSGAQDIQAHLLLGSKGVDLPELSQKLDVLSARKTFEPLEPTSDHDIQAYLKNERENAILSVIEETHQACFEDVERRQWLSLTENWEKEKNKAFNALLVANDGFLRVNVKPERSVAAEAAGGGALGHLETALLAAVAEYNAAVVRGAVRPGLVEKLSAAAKSLNDQKTSDMWEMVTRMTSLPTLAGLDALAKRSKPEVQAALIASARAYLEDRYKCYMRGVVSGNASVARPGGVPGTCPLVRSFAAVRLPSPPPLGLEDGIVDGRPIWPLIYYCLRCGDVLAAVHFARQAGPALEEFCAVLEEVNASHNKRVDARMENTLRFQYRRSIRNTTDPYKRATYCILGSCDPSDQHADIAKTADDYLWMQLCQIREDGGDESRAADRMSYNHLQSLILEEYGESHFNATEHPHVYFQMLFLTGQFEAAVEFLSRVDRLRVHSVHIAIALNELDLLALPALVQAPLLAAQASDVPPARRLNLARLIMLYTRKFEATNPKDALQYYYLLRNLLGSEGRSLFMTCVSDLAMESRDFDLILGRMQPTGCVLPGLIHSFQDVQADAKAITELVATDCEKKGWFEDAIKLHDLASNHTKVLSLMTVLLSQVVPLENKAGAMRPRLKAQADELHHRYHGQSFSCPAETASAFFVLRDLLTFFDQYHAGDYQLALESVARSRLVPMSMAEMDERVSSFKRLGDEVSRVLPDVLLATMNMLYAQYTRLRGEESRNSMSGRFEDTSQDKQLLHIRERARALTSFAGSVPYRMPGDTNGRLVQMEILMN